MSLFFKILPFFLLIQSIYAASTQEGAHIFDENKSRLNEILKHKELTIDHVTPKDYEVYGPKGTIKWLESQQFNFLPLGKTDKALSSDYPTTKEIESNLKKMALENPEILQLFSIGKSVKGKDIWAIKISDNVTEDEVEPEFKYIGNMHGNEIVGREILVKLIKDLVESYKNGDARITNIINNTEIFIIPTMNPDGSDAKRRGNARWVDLNRDFPDFINSSTNSTDKRAPETQALMRFQAKRNFSLSANFHGGNQCVNYPWDTTSSRAPMTDLIIEVSTEYASYIDGMRNSSQFKNGITNGYKWYEVDGGMQDWSYKYYGDMQVTIELSHNKWPRYSHIQAFYEENRPALLSYIERIHQGAGFYLTSKLSGSVDIIKIKKNQEKEFIGSYGIKDGEYYKVLPIGTYDFHINLKNGIKKSIRANITKDNILDNGNYQKI